VRFRQLNLVTDSMKVDDSQGLGSIYINSGRQEAHNQHIGNRADISELERIATMAETYNTVLSPDSPLAAMHEQHAYV
jgi:hypothetical protein